MALPINLQAKDSSSHPTQSTSDGHQISVEFGTVDQGNSAHKSSPNQLFELASQQAKLALAATSENTQTTSGPMIAKYAGSHDACALTIPHGHHVNGKTIARSSDVLRMLKLNYSLSEKERIRRMLEFPRIGDVRCILEGLEETKKPATKNGPGVLSGVGKRIVSAVTSVAEAAMTANKVDSDTEPEDAIVITEVDFEEDMAWSMVAEKEDLEDDWTVVASQS